MSSVSIEGKIQLHIFVKLSRSPEGKLLLSPFSSLSKNCVGLCGNLNKSDCDDTFLIHFDIRCAIT